MLGFLPLKKRSGFGSVKSECAKCACCKCPTCLRVGGDYLCGYTDDNDNDGLKTEDFKAGAHSFENDREEADHWRQSCSYWQDLAGRLERVNKKLKKLNEGLDEDLNRVREENTYLSNKVNALEMLLNDNEVNNAFKILKKKKLPPSVYKRLWDGWEIEYEKKEKPSE